MKNIHLLPTEKPSRLLLSGFGTLFLTPPMEVKSSDKYQNIYITNSEEIKEGDIVYSTKQDYNIQKVSKDLVQAYRDSGHYKKIILTTDQDLIADGVQSFDDELLEWLVKNPSREFVEINIPQEEPKQETLEEVAYNYASKKLQRPITIYTSLDANVAEYVGFIKGAKWQQERMYSEEEVMDIIDSFIDNLEDYTPTFNSRQEWFEQFKKK